MSVVCKDVQSEKECYVFSKGAVESILRHCSRYQKNGEILPLSEEQKNSKFYSKTTDFQPMPCAFSLSPTAPLKRTLTTKALTSGS